jgi:hypothetical protein
VSHRALAAAVLTLDRYTPVEPVESIHRTALRLGWTTVNAHTYGYSISPERGIAAGATGEFARGADERDDARGASTLTADVRAYVPGAAAHHVLAVRGGAGWSSDASGVGRRFLLGGAAPAGDVVDFDADAFGLLRGVDENRFAGSRVAVLNVDYRFPIGRPQRGVGTWPAMLHTVHAAVFADAGHAWSETFRISDVKSSVGAELSVDVVAGYSIPLTVAGGVAWSRVPGEPRSISAYLRLGRAF